MFNVNADFFRAAALFQSTEETRFYLAGVSIEPHPERGALLVATDGHRMLVVHDEDGQCSADRYIVRLDKSALTAAGKRGRAQAVPNRIIGELPSDPVRIEGAGGVLALCPNWNVDGTFPDWRRVAPQKAPELRSAWYNSRYLASFEKAAGLLRDGAQSITISGDGNGPALIRFAFVPFAFGVLMPMRGEGEATIPDFMALPAATPEPVAEAA